MGREVLYNLRAIAEREGLLDKDVPLEQRLASALNTPEIRSMLEIETPQITDLTEIVSPRAGKVYAIRMDLQSGVQNHKKPVVAGLILRNILLGRIPNDQKDTLIDGGNFNSALAVKYYANLLGMRGIYIMSRLFPDGIIELLESEDFRIIRAPKKYEQRREREFYEFLTEKMRSAKFRENKVCLWHAKYGGLTHYPLGLEVAKQVPQSLDSVVSCLGSGSTLEGIQIPIQDYFVYQGRPMPGIGIAEHKLSPLFANAYGSKVTYVPASGALESTYKKRSASMLPHDVLGPHFDEINSLLARSSVDTINFIVHYTDGEWRAMQNTLAAVGVSVGNSSAANIAVAAKLAAQGKSVLTVIFEPYRSFYAKSW